MSVSVIVCTRDRSAWLKWCLASLDRQSQSPAEVLVVDSSDEGPQQDATVEATAGSRGALYVRSDPGLTRQRNVGVARSTGSVLLFVDDDVVLHPDYVRCMAGVFESHSAVVGVGGKVWNEQARGKGKTLYRRLFTIADNERGTVTSSGDAGHIFEFEGLRETAALSGCNMAFRRALFDEAGLCFDERLTGYALMEDLLFSLDARRFGRLVQTSDAVVFHGYRLKDRWSPKYAHDQITHAAYVFGRTRNSTGASKSKFAWRTMGRVSYVLVRATVNGRTDTSRAAIRGAYRVFKALPTLDLEPSQVLDE